MLPTTCCVSSYVSYSNILREASHESGYIQSTSKTADLQPSLNPDLITSPVRSDLDGGGVHGTRDGISYVKPSAERDCGYGRHNEASQKGII